MKPQCCIIVVSIAKLRLVLQMCLQTISSSVLSSDGHLKPACVCKFNLGSLSVIMKIVITTLRLQVCANCWYESYLGAFEWVYPLKTTKTGSKYDQLLRGCDLELKVELLKLPAIQSKISEVNLLMNGRIWE